MAGKDPPRITLQDWLQYLERRLDSWYSQLNILVAIAGLLPVATISAGIGLVPPQWQATTIVLVTAAILLPLSVVLAKLVIRRSKVRKLVEKILEGRLTAPQVDYLYKRWISA